MARDAASGVGGPQSRKLVLLWPGLPVEIASQDSNMSQIPGVRDDFPRRRY